MVERAAVNRDVEGSSPSSGAILTEENGGFSIPCTEIAQKPTRHPDKRATFPIKVESRGLREDL